MIINLEELDMDEELTTYQGLPFNGIMQAFYPGGSKWREYPYKDGFEQGICREWHRNGQLKSEWFAIRGRIDGKETEWHENGQIKSIATYSKAVELVYDEWNDSGVVVTHREINRQSELWKYVNESNIQ